jgi:hypothetical protein
MPKCAKCGTNVDSGVSSCPSCGAEVAVPMTIGAHVSGSSSSSSSSHWRSGSGHLDYASPITTRAKPTSATILTVLAALGGLDAILIAVNMNFLGKLLPSLTIGSSLGLASGSIPFYFMSILGAVSLVSAYLFYKGNNKAWSIGLFFSVLNVLSILWSNYVGFVFGLVTLYFLTRFETKNWFHRA